MTRVSTKLRDEEAAGSNLVTRPADEQVRGPEPRQRSRAFVMWAVDRSTVSSARFRADRMSEYTWIRSGDAPAPRFDCC